MPSSGIVNLSESQAVCTYLRQTPDRRCAPSPGPGFDTAWSNIEFLAIRAPGLDVDVTVRVLGVLMGGGDRPAPGKISLDPFATQRARVVAFNFALEAGYHAIVRACLAPLT